MNHNSSPHAPNYLGIEGGGTRTTVLLEDTEGHELHSFSIGPAVLPLMSDRALVAHLKDIRAQLPVVPQAIGIGLAGVRGLTDKERLERAVGRVWPRVPCVATNDLETALAAAPANQGDRTRVLVLSGTGSCCFGRNSLGQTAKVGGRGHVIGDRASACDIGLRALRAIMADFDHRGRMSPLGASILSVLMFNEAEELIPWSVTASKNEIAQLAVTVFQHASKGQAMAKEILRHASQMLSEDAIACAEKLLIPHEPLEFIFNGAVLLKNPAFLKRVVRNLRVRFPKAKMTPLLQGSVHGAVAIARRIPLFDKDSFNEGEFHPKKTEWSMPPALLDLAILRDSPTEKRHPDSFNLDQMSALEGVDLMLNEEKVVATALAKHRDSLAHVVTKVSRAFQAGGRLFYVGAGTSGRLAVLDASEIPPTFSAPSEQVQGIIAGGRTALWRAVEGAEDDLSSGIRSMAERRVRAHDVVLGIAASGRTPFVWGALHEANRRGAYTVLLCFNPAIERAISKLGSSLWSPNFCLAFNVGPEILTGSTRLKSGTATKLTLNIISTLAMVQNGKTISNLMVDLNPSNAKLRHRAAHMLMKLTDCSLDQANEVLKDHSWVVKDAYAYLLGR